MTVSKSRRPRSAPWSMFLVVVAGVVVIGGVAAMGHLAAGGEIRIPFSDPPRYLSLRKQEPVKPWAPPVGKVPVLTSGRTIGAYARITRDDIVDPKTQSLMVKYVDPSSVEGDDPFIGDARKIIGRVLAHEKARDYAFRESDFLPKGTRPGLVGGIPPGYRGVRIELAKVRGLYALQPGDTFDVVSTIAVASDPAKDFRKLGGAYADRLAIEASLGNLSKQANVYVVVQSGVVVTPPQTIEIPVTMATLTQGSRVNSKPLQEVFIAVHPEEVAPLMEAMSVDADLAVVPRPGRPEDPKDQITPERHPRNPFTSADGKQGPASVTFVEAIGGTKRELVPVPTSGQSGEAPSNDKK